MTEGEDHRYSEGQGFGRPYRGFDLEPSDLTVTLDPTEIDPVDSHVIPDLLDEGVIPKDHVNAAELVEVGLAYVEINRFEEATETFERAARFATNPDVEQEAWVNKGVAHGELEEWDEAIGSFQEAVYVDASPDVTAVAENNLAYALWEFGRDAEALEHAERAVELDERFAEAWYNRGFFLNERALWEQAVDCFENALRLGMRTAGVYEEQARAFEALGEDGLAEEASEKAEEIRERSEEELVRR